MMGLVVCVAACSTAGQGSGGLGESASQTVKDHPQTNPNGAALVRVDEVQAQPSQLRSGGTVNLNASPWAEVWLDGRRIGETPIGNLAVPIGPHEIVFRHPEFGEKKHAVSVTTAAPVRLSVSMK
jgi:hypothetical protein